MITRKKAAELEKAKIRSAVSNDKCPISQENLSDCKKIFVFETASHIRYGYDLEAIRKYLITSKRPVDPLSREFYTIDDLKRIDRDYDSKVGVSVLQVISSERAIGLDQLDEIFERIYINTEEKMMEKLEEWRCIGRLTSAGVPRFLTTTVSGFFLVHLAQMIQADKRKSILFLNKLVEDEKEEWDSVDPAIREVVMTLSRNVLVGLKRYTDLPSKGRDWLNYESRWYRMFFKTRYIDPKNIEEILEELLDEERYIEFILKLQEDFYS